VKGDDARLTLLPSRGNGRILCGSIPYKRGARIPPQGSSDLRALRAQAHLLRKKARELVAVSKKLRAWIAAGRR
jgi:hypothetical protein